MGCSESSIHMFEEEEDSGDYMERPTVRPTERPTYSYQRQRVNGSSNSSSQASSERWNQRDEWKPAETRLYGNYSQRPFSRVDRQDYSAPPYFNGDTRYSEPGATRLRDPYGGRGNIAQSFKGSSGPY